MANNISLFFTNKVFQSDFSTSQEDFKKSSIPVDFYAQTTAAEKTWRIVNNGFGACVLATLLHKIAPAIFGKISSCAIHSLLNLKEKGWTWVKASSSIGQRVSPTAFRCLQILSLLVVARKVMASIASLIVYPAIVLFLDCKKEFSLSYSEQIENLKQHGYLCRRIHLEKSGAKFDGYLIGHQNHIFNGNWTIHGLGNGMCAEVAFDYARDNKKHGSNTLLLNGPGVARNYTIPSRFSLGAGLESAMQFLEKEVGAKRIVMDGLSLGGGMMSEAILQHDFSQGLNDNIRYLSVTRESFDTLSHTAQQIVGLSIIGPFLKYGLGLELDNISAAKKLAELNIRHIIINSPVHDGVIPRENSLSNHFQSSKQRTLLTSFKIQHCHAAKENYPEGLGQQFKNELDQFFSLQDH